MIRQHPSPRVALVATGQPASALSPRIDRSDDGPVILVQDTAARWGDAQWSAAYLRGDAYLWGDAVSGANALFGAGVSGMSLDDD